MDAKVEKKPVEEVKPITEILERIYEVALTFCKLKLNYNRTKLVLYYPKAILEILKLYDKNITENKRLSSIYSIGERKFNQFSRKNTSNNRLYIFYGYLSQLPRRPLEVKKILETHFKGDPLFLSTVDLKRKFTQEEALLWAVKINYLSLAKLLLKKYTINPVVFMEAFFKLIFPHQEPLIHLFLMDNRLEDKAIFHLLYRLTAEQHIDYFIYLDQHVRLAPLFWDEKLLMHALAPKNCAALYQPAQNLRLAEYILRNDRILSLKLNLVELMFKVQKDVFKMLLRNQLLITFYLSQWDRNAINVFIKNKTLRFVSALWKKTEMNCDSMNLSVLPAHEIYTEVLWFLLDESRLKIGVNYSFLYSIWKNTQDFYLDRILNSPNIYYHLNEKDEDKKQQLKNSLQDSNTLPAYSVYRLFSIARQDPGSSLYNYEQGVVNLVTQHTLQL